MLDSLISQPQLKVIMALSEGLSSTDAAAQAGVHRNTIACWRRNSLPFRESLADAQYDRAMFFREKVEALIDLAFKTLDDLLADPKTSPSVRLKAAIFIIEKASTPPPPPQTIDQNAQIVHPVHNNAQNPAPEPDAEAPAAENPPFVHNNAQNAQTPTRRAPQNRRPKVGRNEPCPCGVPSGPGQKHKRCCLNKPLTHAA